MLGLCPREVIISLQLSASFLLSLLLGTDSCMRIVISMPTEIFVVFFYAFWWFNQKDFQPETVDNWLENLIFGSRDMSTLTSAEFLMHANHSGPLTASPWNPFLPGTCFSLEPAVLLCIALASFLHHYLHFPVFISFHTFLCSFSFHTFQTLM